MGDVNFRNFIVVNEKVYGSILKNAGREELRRKSEASVPLPLPIPRPLRYGRWSQCRNCCGFLLLSSISTRNS